jgi:hypothetical protein
MRLTAHPFRGVQLLRVPFLFRVRFVVARAGPGFASVDAAADLGQRRRIFVLLREPPDRREDGALRLDVALGRKQVPGSRK